MQQQNELTVLRQTKRLLQEITDATEHLNKLIRTLPDESIRKNDLYWGYALTSIGNPRIGGSSGHTIVQANQDRKETVVWHSSALNPFDREHARKTLRASKLPEPFIWERWPAHNADERLDKEERLATWAAKNRSKDYQPATLSKTPLEIFLERQARAHAKRTGLSMQTVLADSAWKENQVAFYEDTMSIDLVF